LFGCVVWRAIVDHDHLSVATGGLDDPANARAFAMSGNDDG
jgi:hypothetical protein